MNIHQFTKFSIFKAFGLKYAKEFDINGFIYGREVPIQYNGTSH